MSLRPLSMMLLAALAAVALIACDDDGSGEPDTDTTAPTDTATDSASDTAEPGDTATPSDTASDTTPADTTSDLDDAGDATDADPGDTADVGDAADAGDGEDAPDTLDVTDTSDTSTPEIVVEMEPNDASSLTDTNDVATGQLVQGAVGTADDVDALRLDTTGGKVYTVTLTAPAGSQLEPHLTILDDGRGGEAPGNDYVRIAVDEGGGVATARFVAMGEAGYLLIVRDARNVGGAGGQGSAQHTWEVTITEDDASAHTVAATMFPDTITGSLDSAGDVDLYSFTGTAGMDVIFDLMSSGSMDARLFVVAEATGDWIARNDDRGAGQPDPLIDAFLTESGAMWLVVENIDETATSLGYSIAVSAP